MYKWWCRLLFACDMPNLAVLIDLLYYQLYASNYHCVVSLDSMRLEDLHSLFSLIVKLCVRVERYQKSVIVDI